MGLGHFLLFIGRPRRVQIVEEQYVHFRRGKVNRHSHPPLRTAEMPGAAGKCPIRRFNMQKVARQLGMDTERGLDHFPIRILSVAARIHTYIRVFPFLLLQMDGVLTDAFGLSPVLIFRLNVGWLPVQAKWWNYRQMDIVCQV
jgi:hypothetical protein